MAKILPSRKLSVLMVLLPKTLLLPCFRKTRFKKRTLNIELHNDNWIKNLQNITTSTELEEFIMLLMSLSSTSLSDQKDEIQWRWTGDGCYTIASAYD
jgi:hypothetical protein